MKTKKIMGLEQNDRREDRTRGNKKKRNKDISREISIYVISRERKEETKDKKKHPPLLRSSKPVFTSGTVFTLSDLDRVEERLAESFLPNIASSGLEVAGR